MTQSAATPAKGPLVWLDLDQAALDAAYDQSKYAPNQDLLRVRRAESARIANARITPPKRFRYGTAEIEGLDVYTTQAPNAPILVFIHGGAWRNGAAADFAGFSEIFTHAGAHFVVVDFSSVDEQGGDLFPMVDQVRRAVAWVYRNAREFGGDPEKLYVAGHSSGSHLAGNVVTTDWEKDFGLPRTLVKGGLLASGMYDLKPVRLSARSRYVKFTDAMEEQLSSQRHLDRLHCPVIVAYGTQETPEFQRQGRDMAAAIKAAGKPVEVIVGEALNHFEIVETLANPYGILGYPVLGLMGLRKS
jgi:arylformamidase